MPHYYLSAPAHTCHLPLPLLSPTHHLPGPCTHSVPSPASHCACPYTSPLLVLPAHLPPATGSAYHTGLGFYLSSTYTHAPSPCAAPILRCLPARSPPAYLMLPHDCVSDAAFAAYARHLTFVPMLPPCMPLPHARLHAPVATIQHLGMYCPLLP